MRSLLYPILDVPLCHARGIDPLDLARAWLDGGARWLQVRWKDPASGALLRIVDSLVDLAGRHDADVVVNDRADVARLARAAGVHVGQEDLGVDDVRRVVGPEAIVGVSTHTRDQVDRALASAASYVAVGPIFETRTKDTGYAPRGLELVRYAAGRGKPVVAIGGITLDRAPEVLEAGAASLAVITDVMDGAPARRVARYLALAERAR